jgi:hypothetical protein
MCSVSRYPFDSSGCALAASTALRHWHAAAAAPALPAPSANRKRRRLTSVEGCVDCGALRGDEAHADLLNVVVVTLSWAFQSMANESRSTAMNKQVNSATRR